MGNHNIVCPTCGARNRGKPKVVRWTAFKNIWCNACGTLSRRIPFKRKVMSYS